MTYALNLFVNSDRCLSLKRLSLFFFAAWVLFSGAPAFASVPDVKKKDQTHYVSCFLFGQLGNQLFEVAAALSYAWDHGYTPVFPDLNRSYYALSYNRDHFFFRLDSLPISTEWTYFIAKEDCQTMIRQPEPLPTVSGNLMLKGFFQSWGYFHHHYAQLLEILAPSEEALGRLNCKYGDLIRSPNTVSIHVRTWDATRKQQDKRFPFLGMEYYKKAMELFPPDSIFVIFSDRPNWCKVHFSPLGKNCVFIDGNDPIDDLFLMSMMKHNIIANSSFSWWGAYLNQNSGRIVVTPRFWWHPDLGEYPTQKSALFFDDWVRVDPDYDAPYPQDVSWYDTRSKSSDNL